MLVSSKLAKSDRSSYIYAKWFNKLTETPPQDLSRPGYVHFFLKHTIKLENQGNISSFEVFLASVVGTKIIQKKSSSLCTYDMVSRLRAT